MVLYETGSILFNSNPEGASIYIGGLSQNVNTPCEVVDIPIGEYIYELKMEGYVTMVGNVTVLQDQITEVNVDLIPVPKKGTTEALIDIFKFMMLVGGALGAIRLIERRGKYSDKYLYK